MNAENRPGEDAPFGMADIVSTVRLVELPQVDRADAIAALIQAAKWEDEEIDPAEVLKAIEEREATAQTLVTPDFALPHGVIDWDGDFRVVVGRSRKGIDYGVPEGSRVNLIVLLVIGTHSNRKHIDILAATASLLKDEEFRRQVVLAKNTREMDDLLRAKAGLSPRRQRPKPTGVPKLNSLLVRQAIDLVDDLNTQSMLIATDRPESVPWEPLSLWPGRLLLLTSRVSTDFALQRENTHLFAVRHSTLARMDWVNLGLLLAASAGLLVEEEKVVCVTGATAGQFDSITVTTPVAPLHDMFPQSSQAGLRRINPEVLLRVLSLAIELAGEGREAKPVGALFVVGDTRNVLKHAQQLVLNPFRGYSRQLRNVLDPSLTETIKEFATIDGAFLIQTDGIVHSAGTYLVPHTIPKGLPRGLGARHQTAAAITADTRAVAIVVSQSTGAVCVFRSGKAVVTFERASPTRW